MTVIWRRLQGGDKSGEQYREFNRCFRNEYHRLIGMKYFEITEEKFDPYSKHTTVRF